MNIITVIIIICLRSREARFYSISCSIHDNLGTNPYKQSFGIRKIINHETYNPNTFANDISVMVLRSQPTENNYLQPVCVATQDYYGGEGSFVIGWGTLSEGRGYLQYDYSFGIGLGTLSKGRGYLQ